MTIEYLADQAILMVTGGRPTVEGIDKREVIAMVKEAIPLVATKEYWDNYKAFNQSEVQGQWLVPFEITLTQNTMLGLKQAILPESYIALPKNRGVNKVQGGGLTLPPMAYDKYEMLKGGSLLEFLDKPSYALLANTVLILPTCAAPPKLSTVVVTLAVANSTTLTESQGLLVLNNILPNLRLRMGMPADMITDQNPNVK